MDRTSTNRSKLAFSILLIHLWACSQEASTALPAARDAAPLETGTVGATGGASSAGRLDATADITIDEAEAAIGETADTAFGDAGGNESDVAAEPDAAEGGDARASTDDGDAPSDAARCEGPLALIDPGLDRAVRGTLRIPSGPIFAADARKLVTLMINGSSGSIESLAGLECFTSLGELDIVEPNAKVTDLSPLASLHALHGLVLWSCGGPVDVRPLAGLTELRTLELETRCGVSDLSPLFGLARITILDFEFNRISDLTQFLHFPELSRLFVGGNPIECDATQRDALRVLLDRNVLIDFRCP